MILNKNNSMRNLYHVKKIIERVINEDEFNESMSLKETLEIIQGEISNKELERQKLIDDTILKFTNTYIRVESDTSYGSTRILHIEGMEFHEYCTDFKPIFKLIGTELSIGIMEIDLQSGLLDTTVSINKLNSSKFITKELFEEKHTKVKEIVKITKEILS
tara:strand:+ start:1937 stop:2419 length:483 start_codon:yes stop_codon:yes gene_type:complete